MEDSRGTKFWMSTNRIETLVDGIFAIAMTLLVLSLAVPEIAVPLSDSVIRISLQDILPKFYVFVLSFILLALFWTIHHRTFHIIKRADNVLLWINIIWLLFIVMVPFSQTLVGDYGHFTTPHFIFNLNMLGIAILLTLNGYYASKNNLMDENISQSRINAINRSCIMFVFITLLAITLSFIVPQWSSLAYVLIIPMEKFIVKL
ncbi:TMEM175 family protein [Methanobacterium sp. ACI-7]|uniref:TMEM175 family protein n=1 Tax=unclassified Methanobacterium TaxID=2627676 RepID=UPI0039C0BBFC